MRRRIFDAENPIMQALSAACDLLVLNLLTAVCCVPIVTAGAALTALFDVSLRLVRGEAAGIVRGYLRAFRANLKKGSALGLVFLLAAAVLLVDFFAAQTYAPPLRVPVVAAALLVGAAALYAFALLARYENTLAMTLKNAATLSVAFFPKTLGMLLFTVGLWVVCLSFAAYALPVLMMFGLSLPGYVCALLCDGVFKSIETETKEEDR